MDEEIVPIAREPDIVHARQQGRALAAALGFGSTDQTLIATAISEVTRNIVVYAGTGELVLAADERAGRRGILVIARDQGPGIADVEQAMRNGYSTQNTLGLGLPGARRLMDELTVETSPRGTTITMRKWVP